MEHKDNHYYAQQVLKVLDTSIAAGPWDKSLFLRATGQKLRELRDNYKQDLGLFAADEDPKSVRDSAENEVRCAGKQEIFVSLYSAKGGDLHSWENILTALHRHIVSRPIYATEDGVKTFMRARACKEKEAYVAVYIDTDDILVQDTAPKDQLGNELLTVKERAIKLECITRFVHASGIYVLRKGKLVPHPHL